MFDQLVDVAISYEVYPWMGDPEDKVDRHWVYKKVNYWSWINYIERVGRAQLSGIRNMVKQVLKVGSMLPGSLDDIRRLPPDDQEHHLLALEANPREACPFCDRVYLVADLDAHKRRCNRRP
ncbi:MAG: hypothetical protein LN413_06705 [Candidatus Thermoplasmatota archaeon]|nr:hypothetical protein [Candidatus Thermoplasmatota archaeon]